MENGHGRVGLAGRGGPPARMSRTIHVHPRAKFQWGEGDELAPGFGIDARDADGAKVPVYAVKFSDPDGEEHVFLFSEDGKERFVAAATGGVILADRMPSGDG
jgi:hypothetical protein